MKRLIKNLVAVVMGCALIYGANNYLIPFTTEESAMVFSVIALTFTITGVYGILAQLINK